MSEHDTTYMWIVAIPSRWNFVVVVDFMYVLVAYTLNNFILTGS